MKVQAYRGLDKQAALTLVLKRVYFLIFILFLSVSCGGGEKYTDKQMGLSLSVPKNFEIFNYSYEPTKEIVLKEVKNDSGYKTRFLINLFDQLPSLPKEKKDLENIVTALSKPMGRVPGIQNYHVINFDFEKVRGEKGFYYQTSYDYLEEDHPQMSLKTIYYFFPYKDQFVGVAMTCESNQYSDYEDLLEDFIDDIQLIAKK